jgi:hypothetical protein
VSLLSALAAPLVLAGPPALAGPAEVRYALVAGADDGGPGRDRLRFAVTDALAVGGMLTELGGVAPEHLVTLVEPTRVELLGALAALGEEVRREPGETTVVVYYAGHSDSTGLLLAGESLRWGELRAAIEGLDADLRVAVVDGCASGAMFRARGGTAAPSFLAGQATPVEGYAFLTSSAADELSQEADHLGGGTFTHSLLTGLRGAADFDQNRRVTLREAFQFASDQTLARTELTRLGAQHPAYDLSLSGTGDIVLTDLSSGAATLALTDRLQGRVFLRDREGRLVAELFKQPGRTVDLALTEGRYSLVLEDGGELFRARAVLEPGTTVQLGPDQLEPAEPDATLARGQIYADVPVAITLVPTVTTHGLAARDQLHHVSFGIVAVDAARLRGVGLGSVATVYSHGADGVQLAGAWNHGGSLMRGAQLTFGVNTAGAVHGVQLGAINVASRRVLGAQLGVVNVARTSSGVSLGAILVARHAKGVQLALLPLIGDGIHHLEVEVGTRAPVSASLKLGSRTLYTKYTAGWSPAGEGSVGGGLGARARAGGWHIDADLSVAAAGLGGASVLLPGLAAALARPLAGEHLAPFVAAGVALELPLEGPDPEGVRLVPAVSAGFRL